MIKSQNFAIFRKKFSKNFFDNFFFEKFWNFKNSKSPILAHFTALRPRFSESTQNFGLETLFANRKNYKTKKLFVFQHFFEFKPLCPIAVETWGY